MKLSRLLTGTVLVAGLLAAATPAQAVDLVELKVLGEGQLNCAPEWCYVCVNDDICVL